MISHYVSSNVCIKVVVIVHIKSTIVYLLLPKLCGVVLYLVLVSCVSRPA